MSHKVLIVDNEKINVSIVKFMLREQGYQVYVASDAKVGIEEVKSEVPDLIILDIQMSTLTGEEFVNQLKTLVPDRVVPVIMLTTDNRMEENVFKFEGVRGLLVKSIHVSHLVTTVNEIFKE